VTIGFPIPLFLFVPHCDQNPISSFFRDIGPKDNWVTTLTFLGHVTSSVAWPLDSPYPISYSCPIVTKPLSPALFKILGPKYNLVTTLTFLGHVTSSVTWPLDSPYPISYSCPIVTKPLSPALFEILGPKDNWVTTLTFLGHVTSSVTWPLDSPYPFSYSCPIVTKPLSPALFEILGPKVPCAHTHTHTLTHRHTPQSDFIFCPMQGIALDRQISASLTKLCHIKRDHPVKSCAQNVHHQPKRIFWHFSQTVRNFQSNFTRLLSIHIYARMQIFVQLSPTVTKLCHIKYDHPACVSVDGGHSHYGGRA